MVLQVHGQLAGIAQPRGHIAQAFQRVHVRQRRLVQALHRAQTRVSKEP